ncbi:MAG: TolC family protein [Sulfuricella sp.]
MQFVTIFHILRGRMRLMRHLIGVSFLLASLYPLPALPAPLTLEQAWEQAEQANPALRSTQANLAAAEGELTDARAPLWNNPQLATEWRKRTTPHQGVRPQTGPAVSCRIRQGRQPRARVRAGQRDADDVPHRRVG